MDDVRTEVVSTKTYSDDETSEAFSENQGAILWPRRSLLYRVCFLSIMPLFIIFLVGFSSPFWMRKHQVDKYRGHYPLMKVDVTIGLWRVCEGRDFNDISDCTSLPDVTSYMMACQAMLCLCFIFTFFSLVFGLYENCATRYDIDDGGEARTKRPEMNAITAGIFGLVGVSMYGVTIIDVSRNGEGAVHWAFPVTAGSVTGLIVCGILMAIANPINSSMPSFPGQVMSLSRQNSARNREPSAQDRLVSMNESQVSSQQPPGNGNASGAGGSTQYGVTTTMNSETSQRRPQRPLLPGLSPLMPRSESCLSSHVSSPDLYTSVATTADGESSEGHQSTQAALEIHAHHSGQDDDECDPRTGGRSTATLSSSSRRVQTAAQRRSWHFDDRSDVTNASDLIDFTANPRLVATHKPPKKPPVPPRRDKQGSSAGLASLPDGTDSRDLLESNNTPSILRKDREGSLPRQDVTQEQPKKRNTNPFLDDSTAQSTPAVPPPPPPPPPVKPSTNLPQGDANSLSNESWDNQPWPEPPPPHLPAMSASPVPSDTEVENINLKPFLPISQVNNVPESLQYQPQNSYLVRGSSQGQSIQSRDNQMQELRTKETESRSQGNKTPAGQQDKARRALTPSSKQMADNRPTANQTIAKPTRKAPPVPILREYDNPLFNDQSIDERRAQAYADGLTPPMAHHTTATSFVNPDIQGNPPSYYSVVDTLGSEPATYRRHSSHYPYPLTTEDIRSTSPPKYSRPRMANGTGTQNHRARGNNANGAGNRTRPRQVKREHHQRRNNNTPDGQHTQLQASPRDQCYGSSPDLMARSPRVGRKRLDATGGGDGESPRRGRQGHHRATEPRKYPAGNFPPHWADSDL
ncbi:hypothetical protein PoB_007287600 [Plakobranchus ocellatus]|uniref:Uncharacterized protein n=1 Tax=Plakobranchus ocellatus TaxID=259542 RepID=A0AAV4DQH4_9GAST|nr:hypothetical protein PoB_007287600 [Plakobranchus ocellatus]